MSTGRSTTIRDRDRRAIRRHRPPCGICEGEIDYTLAHTDPMSFVVDHIIPIDKGGPDVLENKQAAHRSCNRDKGNALPPGPDRNVVLICGPAGAGKSTLAHSLGLPVYDLDDPHWAGDEAAFRIALARLTEEPDATAAVIRSAATTTARARATRLCGATSVRVLDVPLDECVRRIKERGRTSPPIHTQIAAAKRWWKDYEPVHDDGPRVFVTARSW